MDADLARARSRLGRVLSDRWTLEEVLGVGGMAAVYRAVDRTGSRAAIKLLHPEISLNPTLRERFLREGYAANRIQHDGVVKVAGDDVYTTENTVYLVMELLEGEPLAERLKRVQKLGLSEALSFGWHAADALVAAHAAGIIHRDIKPENLFLTAQGRVKILDFGLARLRERTGMAATKEGSLLGTPAFMSPEQATGSWSQVDARADIWSLGATIFTLISGRNVHDGRTPLELLVAAARTPARSLGIVVPDAPTDVVTTIDKALAFHAQNRYADMAAFRDALARAGAALSAAAPKPRTAGLAATVFDPHALREASAPTNPSVALAAPMHATPAGWKAPAVAVIVFLSLCAAGALAWYFLARG
jgi:serine/threonine-protein kinase